MGYQYGGRNTLTFGKLPGYKNLIVWQKGSDLSDLLHEATKRFGPGYYKLIDQVRSAAVSVTGNISEGYCGGSLGNYIRHCLIARGSLGELGSYIQDCERWGLIGGEVLKQIVELYAETSFLLDRLIQSLRRKQQEGTWDQQFWVKEGAENYDIEAIVEDEEPNDVDQFPHSGIFDS